MLEIHGLACPFNKFNSWNELIRPGAFSKFIKDLKGEPIPMRLMHEDIVGFWDEFDERESGLYCRGAILKEFAPLVEEYPELSITWAYYDPETGKLTEKRFNYHIPEMQSKIIDHRVPVVKYAEIEEAKLAEISLVDDGAFKPTWVARR